jgi:hypothetical protein
VIGIAPPVWLGSNPLLRSLRVLPPGRAGLAGITPAEQTKLTTAGGMVLNTLGLGFRLGRWPVWATLIAAAVYVAWVALYSEIVGAKPNPATHP